MKKKLCFLFLPLVLLSGCYVEYREADKMTIVSGIGIEVEGDHYRYVTEAVNARGGEGESQSVLIQATGHTLAEGMSDCEKLTGQRLYFTHADVLILSRELAEQGLHTLVNSINMQKNFPLSLRVLVTDSDMYELMSAESLMQTITSFKMNGVLTMSNLFGHAVNMPFYKFAAETLESGIDSILPYVHLRENFDKQTQEVTGCVLFKGEQMVYKLPEEEAQYLFWLRGDISHGGIFHDSASFAVTGVKPRITCDGASARVELELKIRLVGSLLPAEMQVGALERQAEETLESLVDILQEQGCDSLGLGRTFKRRDPQGWKRIEQEWTEIYQSMPIEVKVSIDMIETGRAAG